MEEKKLITFENVKEICGYHTTKDDAKCYFFHMETKCNAIDCPIWQNLESPEEKITIVPANGAKRNGWM